MIRPVLVAVLAALATGVAPARAGDCAAFALDCGARPAASCGALGDASAPHRIRAVGLACRGARRVAKAQWLQSGRFDRCAPRRRTCRVAGYRCAWQGTRTVTCRAGARRVRFGYDR